MATKKRPTEDDSVSKLQKLVAGQCSESDAAEEVARAALLDRFRYAPALGWLRWDGSRWSTDETGERSAMETVRRFVASTEARLRNEAFRANDARVEILGAVMGRHPDPINPDQKPRDLDPKTAAGVVDIHGTAEEKTGFASSADKMKDLLGQANMWQNLGTKAKLSSVMTLCSGMDDILTRAADLDAHPDFLNCANGHVDLRTGRLHEPDPKMLFSKVAGGAYEPGATHSAWSEALKAVHPDLLDWYQLRMGQSISGYVTDDDSMVVACGGGENGKTAVMMGITRAAGDYYTLVPHKALLMGSGEHTTELMDFRGARIALLEETPEEGRLDTHRIKTTIGTAQIKARLMRADNVTFTTSHSLWINTNHMPTVDTTDWGTWRRLKAMPWPYTFRKPGSALSGEFDRAGDLGLKPALQMADGVPEAVIAWLVKGAMQWYAGGRQMPEDPDVVVAATAEWRGQSDVGLQFVQDHLTADPDSYVTADVMRGRFSEFLEAMGKRSWSAQLMNTRLPDSMATAGIFLSATPAKPAKVRSNDTQSIRKPADPFKNEAKAAEIVAGRTTRMWRGVRFLPDDEIGTGHLRAV